MIETIIPENEAAWLGLRKKDITSTETAALFWLSPYITQYELWHRKHDNLDVQFEVSDRMQWGTRLQDSIAAGVAEDQQWTIRRMSEYVRDPELRMGASFDFRVLASGRKDTIGILKTVPNLDDSNGDLLLEIKNVDSLVFRDGWIVDGDNVEAPPHIEIQVQQQLALSGLKTAYIGALIGGNRVVLIKREPDQVVIDAIKKRIREFWESVDRNVEPAPGFKRDSDFISRLFSFAEPGKIFNADEHVSRLAYAYKAAADEAKAADEKKDAAKAELLTMIGTAEKVLGETFTISCGLVGPAHVEYDRAGYRSFKISWKKQKP